MGEIIADIRYDCFRRKRRHPDSYRFNRGQRKRRRNLIIAVRKLGYTSKAELRSHLQKINQAVKSYVLYQMPKVNSAKLPKKVAPEVQLSHGTPCDVSYRARYVHRVVRGYACPWED